MGSEVPGWLPPIAQSTSVTPSRFRRNVTYEPVAADTMHSRSAPPRLARHEISREQEWPPASLTTDNVSNHNSNDVAMPPPPRSKMVSRFSHESDLNDEISMTVRKPRANRFSNESVESLGSDTRSRASPRPPRFQIPVPPPEPVPKARAAVDSPRQRKRADVAVPARSNSSLEARIEFIQDMLATAKLEQEQRAAFLSADGKEKVLLDQKRQEAKELEEKRQAAETARRESEQEKQRLALQAQKEADDRELARACHQLYGLRGVGPEHGMGKHDTRQGLFEIYFEYQDAKHEMKDLLARPPASLEAYPISEDVTAERREALAEQMRYESAEGASLPSPLRPSIIRSRFCTTKAGPMSPKSEQCEHQFGTA